MFVRREEQARKVKTDEKQENTKLTKVRFPTECIDSGSPIQENSNTLPIMRQKFQDEDENVKVKSVNVSQQSNPAAQPEHLGQEPEGDHLVRQVALHQDQLQTDSDFIRHHSQDQAAQEPFHQNLLDHLPDKLADQFTHQEVNQAGQEADLQPRYQTDDQTQVFNLQSISDGTDQKVYQAMEDRNSEQMNLQAVAGFQLLDVLEDDEEEEEGKMDAHTIEEEKVEKEAVEMKALPEEKQISTQSNRTFEDIFNEAGSFIDEEDIFMEEYERLDDQEENDSGEDNDEVSVVNHFKSIKFAKPIPKWP